MSRKRPTTDDASGARFTATYSFQGTIDVDALLAAAAPRRAHGTWRAGEEHQGFTFGSSGIQLVVGTDPDTVGDALARFLDEEQAFLRAVERQVSATASATVTLYVSPDTPGPFVASFPPSLLQQLATRSIKLNVLWSPALAAPAV